jgi:hypothetical protein
MRGREATYKKDMLSPSLSLLTIKKQTASSTINHASFSTKYYSTLVLSITLLTIKKQTTSSTINHASTAMSNVCVGSDWQGGSIQKKPEYDEYNTVKYNHIYQHW